MGEKRIVLIVDDNTINRKILRNILSEQYDLLEADNGKDGFCLLEQYGTRISAVLLDIVMPILDGYGFLEAVSKNERLTSIPIIVTTQDDDEATEIKSLSYGAIDFLTKPYKPVIIKQRLANMISLRETASIINAMERDALTGLYTREFFYQTVSKVIKSSPTSKYDIIVGNIEKFKIVNDLFGIKEGDELLTFVAKQLTNYFDQDAIIGRLEADSFAIFLGHQTTWNDDFFAKCNQLLNQCSIDFNLVMKFGIYVVDEQDVSVNIMCDRAELAMQKIKGKYQEYFTYYDEEIREQLLKESKITDSMEKAILEREFEVYYQPKFDITDSSIIGAEALIRWIHPESGMISPGEFIPLFERNGFITDLDIYVWDNVCKNLSDWIEKGNVAVPVSVNVSRIDFYKTSLPSTIYDITQRYGLDSSLLQLEITESAYTENPVQLLEAVEQLKSYGFTIVMDDFGKGYSSLNMLSDLPIDVIKLDLGFLHSKKSARSRDTILKFVLSLARWMNLPVISEGVENIEQIELLRSLDCKYVQGYYYARPMPKDEFEDFIKNTKIQKL